MYLHKKNKYNNKMSLIGGSGEGADKKIKDSSGKYPDLDLSGWNFIKVDGIFRDKLREFIIYECKFNDDISKPNLVVMSGFSLNSVRESGYVILDKLDVLATKYRAVYIINLSNFKEPQNDACDIRDKYGLDPELLDIISKLGKKSEEYKAYVTNPEYIQKLKSPECLAKVRNPEYRYAKNEQEIQVYRDASDTLNDILINKLKLINIHLLGECAGGGLAIRLVEKSELYTRLFLAVPSSPNDVKELTPRVLNTVKLRFSWNINDDLQYSWHKEEDDGKNNSTEKDVYDNQMKEFIRIYPDIDYVSFMFSQDPRTTIANNRNPAHEIHRKFIDFFCSELN